MRNINKQGFKFKFELHIESVEKIINSNEICITWERNGKVASTKPARVDKNTRTAHFGGDSISQEVTLFKRKKEGSSFDDKVFRLAARNNNETGKILGRIDINASEYVDIPSFSKRVGAALNNNARVIMRVESTFLGEAKSRKPGSRGTSSIGSSTLDVADDQSSVDDSDRLNENDFDDLSIDTLESDVPNSTNSTTAAANATSLSIPNRPPVQPQPQPPRRVPLPSSTPKEEPPRERRRPSAQSPSRDSRMRHQNDLNGTTPVVSNDLPGPSLSNAPSLRQRSSARSDTVDPPPPGPSKSEFDKMRRENRALQRKNNDLQNRVSELEDQLDAKADIEGNGESIEELNSEIVHLKAYTDDLEIRLKREPLYSDVVRELREAKMALAILTLEKDELIQELRRMKRNG